jgi:hypothetical protein
MAEPLNHAKRPFTAWNTFWLFLSQVLNPPAPCREAVCAAQAHLADPRATPLSTSSSAYCQARARLALRTLWKAFEQLKRSIQGPRPPAAWRGRVVRVIDGSSLSMPDTPANQRRYPQPSSQKAGCGFPVMRVCAVFCLATGAMLGMARGALCVSERTLGRRLWKLLEKGSVLLGDRGFCSFADFHMLRQRGLDAVMRLHQRRGPGARRIRRLGKNDWLVDWIRTGPAPDWLTAEQWRALPPLMTVRHVKVEVKNKGFRTKTIVVATTILDPKAYPAWAFADLYRRRWLVELFLRDIKITMGMDHLRCKSPAMVLREVVMHMIAYNLVRAVMLEAARQHRVDPARLSLAGTATAIRVWAPALAMRQSAQQRHCCVQTLLRHIAHDPVPTRPNRVEPRALKRRPKNYQLLNKPRRQFKETLHRSRYQKALS